MTSELRFRCLSALVGLFVLTHMAVSAATELGADLGRINTLIMPVTIALFAGLACSTGAQNYFGSWMRLGWRFAAVSSLVWVVGHVASGGTGKNNISVLFLLPIALLSLGRTAVVASRTDARWRSAFEGITVTAAFSLLAWLWFVVPHKDALPAGLLQRSWVSAHLLTDVATASIVATAVLRWGKVRRFPTRTIALLCIALTGYLFADMAVVFSGAGAMSWGWSIGFGGMGLAALSPQKRRGRAKQRSLAYAYVMPSVLGGVAVLSVVTGIGEGNRGLAATVLASAVVVCLMVREFMASREEQRLTQLLEGRIADRNEELSRRERQFEALVQHSSDLIIIMSEGCFTYVSPSAQVVLGQSVDELTGASVESIVAPQDKSRVDALLKMAGRRAGATVAGAWTVLRTDGSLRQVEVLIRNLTDEPAVNGLVFNLRDVTERKNLEDRLHHQALHDELTGLPNRSLLRRHIEQSLAGWQFQNDPFSLIVLDLDDFKSINDSYGHVTGDEVLKTLAVRLGGCVRAGDSIVRLNGDEFAVLLEGVTAAHPEALEAAARIIEALQEPIRVEGRSLMLRGSLGLACVTDAVVHADDILRNANLALHSAKLTNRGGFVRFESQMHDQALQRMELEADLRRALENDEFLLHYQPTVNVQTGIIEGVEALLRWPHPIRGYVSPVDFIPIAEEAGLIVPIGTWVLKQACNEMRKWQSRYPGHKPLTLNVNLSGRQLDQPDVVDIVRSVLEDSALEYGTLVLEMTESVLMDDNPETLAKMQDLVDLGVKLAIDDFGTGYSSLSYLSRFPIEVLKIDRYFVSDLATENAQGEAPLVQAIIDIARTMRLKTVAEGIETHEQMDELRRMGCDIGQGFLMARPQPAEDVRRLLENTFALGKPVPAFMERERANHDTA